MNKASEIWGQKQGKPIVSRLNIGGFSLIGGFQLNDPNNEIQQRVSCNPVTRKTAANLS